MHLIVNGATVELPSPSSIIDLLARMGLGERRTAVEVNGRIVPRSEHAQAALNDGDHVEVVQAIGGG